MKSTSILDNFFVSERLLENIEDAGVLHLGDNLSRHSPIMLKLKLDTVIRKTVDDPVSKRRPAWYKANEDNKQEYTELLSDKLSQIDTPGSLKCVDVHCDHHGHSGERDKFVLDILCNMIETSYECIPLSTKTKVKKPGQMTPRLPGWKRTVKPLREDSVFWHSVWVSSGRPPGALHGVMAWSRRKYHQAVKKAKRLAGSLMAQDLLEASEKGDRDLMEELKKSMDKKCSE